MARPNFCPNCGGRLPEGPHGAQAFSVYPTGVGGWDCYCDGSQWSGDILPDDEAEKGASAQPAD